MGSDAEALPEAFLKAFETLNTEVDAAARKKAPSLIQAFHDIRAAADTIVVDSDIYRSLDTAGQSAETPAAEEPAAETSAEPVSDPVPAFENPNM